MTAKPEPNGTGRQRDPLARAIALLTHMVESEDNEFGVRQLGAAISTSGSTAHRLLTDLESLGLVSRTPSGSYRLGLGFYRLATLGAAKFSLRKLAKDALGRLARAVDETTFFGLYDEGAMCMTFAATAESTKPLRYVVELDQRIPLHAGASGLAILASLPKPSQDAIMGQSELTAVTDRTTVDTQSLERRLEEIRQRGYAISRGERIPGALAIAAPVLGPHNAVVGDIGVTMPEANFIPAREEAVAMAVMAAADELSSMLRGE